MKLIIFDMDGTLIDSGNVIANTINFVRRNIGLKELEKEHLLKSINNPDINPAEFFYGTQHFTDEQTKLFSEYYHKNCINDIRLYDGIEDILSELFGVFKLSVATNASTIFAQKMLRHLKIEHFFETVIGADKVDNPKPKPDMLLKIIEMLNTKKEKTLLVGDSHKDLLAAQNAGIKSIMVNWGFTDFKDNEAVETTKMLVNRIFTLSV